MNEADVRRDERIHWEFLKEYLKRNFKSKYIVFCLLKKFKIKTSLNI